MKIYRRLFATATLVNHETQQGRNRYSWLPQSQLISNVLFLLFNALVKLLETPREGPALFGAKLKLRASCQIDFEPL